MPPVRFGTRGLLLMLQVNGLAAKPRGRQGLPGVFHAGDTQGQLHVVGFGARQPSVSGGQRIGRRRALKAIIASLAGGGAALWGVRSCQRQQHEAALALAEAIPTNSVIRLEASIGKDGTHMTGTVGQHDLDLQIKTTSEGTLIFGALKNPEKGEMLPFRLLSKKKEPKDKGSPDKDIETYDITGNICKSLQNNNGEWMDPLDTPVEKKKNPTPKGKTKAEERPRNIKLTSTSTLKPGQSSVMGKLAEYHLVGDLGGLDMNVTITTKLLEGVHISGTLAGKPLSLKLPTLELGRTYGVYEAPLLVRDNQLRVLQH